MIRKLLLGLGLAAASTLVLAQAPAKLRVGISGDYPPFSQIAPDGKLSGFDIDIANALCKAMKLECVLVQQEWDGMIPALNVKKYDVIVASMTVSPERLQRVDFSEPYYDVPSRFIAKEGAFKDHSPAALKGKEIAVLRNSPRAKFLQEYYKDAKIVEVNKEPEVYMALSTGRADVGFGSSVVSGEAFLKKPEGKGYAQLGPAVNLGAGAGVGIAIRKGDTGTRDKVNAALKQIKADGTYKALAAKYFDFDISGGTVK